MIPLQLPTLHSTTINSGGGGWACDSPSVAHTTFYYNQFWRWGLVLVIPLQLPTPHSAEINSGGGCGARDSSSVTHTTFYYKQFWWWGLGL